MNFEIKGLDSLMHKIEALGGCTTKAATTGLNKTLQDITTDAKENCPVDTSQLRDSIEPYGEAHKAKEQGGVVSGAAGTNVEHGPYVEFGTGPVGEATAVSGKYPETLAYTQKGWTYCSEKLGQFIHTRGQPAQPYLWPAYEAHAKELPDNIKKAADEEIRGLAK
jgi:HK97 gp10 family phage protein